MRALFAEVLLAAFDSRRLVSRGPESDAPFAFGFWDLRLFFLLERVGRLSRSKRLLLGKRLPLDRAVLLSEGGGMFQFIGYRSKTFWMHARRRLKYCNDNNKTTTVLASLVSLASFRGTRSRVGILPLLPQRAEAERAAPQPHKKKRGAGIHCIYFFLKQPSSKRRLSCSLSLSPESRRSCYQWRVDAQ